MAANFFSKRVGGVTSDTFLAYFGLKKIGQPVQGDTVVVSGAAGGTGSVAVQVAKLMGARVVGIAGNNDKCRWVESLGADVCLNYKDKDFEKQLADATPNEINVYCKLAFNFITPHICPISPL